MTQTGTVIATISAGVATDLAGNPNTASTSTDNTVTFNVPGQIQFNKSDCAPVGARVKKEPRGYKRLAPLGRSHKQRSVALQT
jgi:hypothetical protein